LLSNKADSLYTGRVIANWASRYLHQPEKESIHTKHQVAARLAEDDTFTTEVQSGPHSFLADEPKDIGGKNLGPSPYDLLAASLASCSSMTMQMYAKRKEWSLEEVVTHVTHRKEERKTGDGKSVHVDVFEKHIEIEAPSLSKEQIERIRAIASKCPVHRTLESGSEIV
jgi:putative redox protein